MRKLLPVLFLSLSFFPAKAMDFDYCSKYYSYSCIKACKKGYIKACETYRRMPLSGLLERIQPLPDLGDGTITNMIGTKDFNYYELQSGQMGDLRILPGTKFMIGKGGITGTIVGVDSKSGWEWTITFSAGSIIKAEVAGFFSLRKTLDDKQAYITTTPVAGISASVTYDNGEWYISSVQLPNEITLTSTRVSAIAKDNNEIMKLLNDLTKNSNTRNYDLTRFAVEYLWIKDGMNKMLRDELIYINSNPGILDSLIFDKKFWKYVSERAGL